jgi:membrane protease subunit HflC
MKNAALPIILLLIVAAVLFYASVYTVAEGKQVVITQFGKQVRCVQEAGLQVKVPFIQTVHVLEKRLLPWDGDAENMQTRDKKRIFIDVWARWRISEPEKFFEAVRTEQNGHKILDDLVDAAVRDVVAQNNLIDVVRSTNDELIYQSEEIKELAPAEEEEQDLVTTGRAKMEQRILEIVGEDLEKNNYGMELVDVHVKRINYIESVKETVYGRMQSERLRIARLFESEAEKEKNRIEGLTRKELDQIEGDMKQKSAEIRGAADAEVIRLTAEAYGQSPEFFQFLRRLEVFKQTLGQDTRVIMSTDSDLFELLKETDAVKPATNKQPSP